MVLADAQVDLNPHQQARSSRRSNALKEAKKAARLAQTLPEKLGQQRGRPEPSKPNVRTRGGPMTRPVATSTGSRMPCSTRSAGGWSSASNKNRYSPCAGIWRDLCSMR